MLVNCANCNSPYSLVAVLVTLPQLSLYFLLCTKSRQKQHSSLAIPDLLGYTDCLDKKETSVNSFQKKQGHRDAVLGKKLRTFWTEVSISRKLGWAFEENFVFLTNVLRWWNYLVKFLRAFAIVVSVNQ